MNSFLHCKSSMKRYGGMASDYQAIHDFIDSTKIAMPDVRHRAILHSAFGIFLAERVFGTTITNAQGKEVSVRQIAEDHVIEDLGFIPTMEQYLNNMQVQAWMSGTMRNRKRVSFEKLGRKKDDVDGNL